jgi:hypothetical protein
MTCVEAQGGGNFKTCRRSSAQPEPPFFLKARFSQTNAQEHRAHDVARSRFPA